jgi:hypothetical protein
MVPFVTAKSSGFSPVTGLLKVAVITIGSNFDSTSVAALVSVTDAGSTGAVDIEPDGATLAVAEFWLLVATFVFPENFASLVHELIPKAKVVEARTTIKLKCVFSF